MSLQYFAVAKTIEIALVSSRLDNYNIDLKYILKLSPVENCLSRVVTRSPRFPNSVPLKLLHSFFVRYHAMFKICTFTYQALSSKQPAYLHSLLVPARQPRQLRQSNYNHLFVPSVKTNVGTRAFQLLHRLCGTHSLLVLSL